MTIEAILRAASDEPLARTILDAYKQVEEQFFLRKWKYSQLDSGHFVEAVRRFIELKLFGKYTPLSQGLSSFTEQVLINYEKASGDESYRLIIPRVLYAAYCIRNKRGVGHLGQVSANEIDASLVVQSIRWTLAELIRLNSTSTADATLKMLADIVERRLPLIWKNDKVTKILDPTVRASDAVLVLLLDTSPQTAEQLRKAVEYRNPTNFKQVLRRLHLARYIHHDGDGSCEMLPPGRAKAEELVLSKAPWFEAPKTSKAKPKRKKK